MFKTAHASERISRELPGVSSADPVAATESRQTDNSRRALLARVDDRGDWRAPPATLHGVREPDREQPPHVHAKMFAGVATRRPAVGLAFRASALLVHADIDVAPFLVVATIVRAARWWCAPGRTRESEEDEARAR